MNLHAALTHRYTAKAFDPTQVIGAEHEAQIEEMLRLAPSSTNAQPWHFVIAKSCEGKAKIAEAMQGDHAYNQDKVKKASHVVVLCSKTLLDDQHLQQVLEQEQHDGRFKDDAAKQKMHNTRVMYVRQHQLTARDMGHWVDKQVYIALGMLLLGVAELGIDACPMEGFDRAVLDQQLSLAEHNLTSAVVVALGYHSDEDFNAKLPKSRLPKEVVISYL